MTSTVTASSDRPLLDILRALFPAASITGAPKRHTMSLIAELEDQPRQIYTGSIGYLRPDGSAQFNVAIRTALVDKVSRIAEYGVGGGIVWDSDAEEEYQECLTKARIVQQPPAAFDLLETMLWTPEGGYALLPEHLARVERAANFFHRPADILELQQKLENLAVSLDRKPQRIRLVVGPDGEAQISAAPLEPLPDPYRLVLAPDPQNLQNNPYVAHKTTRRDVYDAAREAATDADDVLLWNPAGELTESTIANLFLEFDGVLVTPPLSSGLLAGLYRQRLLDTGKATEGVLRADDLCRADAVYLGNSVRGLWRVTLAKPSRRGDHL
jgi:para-aminobenzoate synthetase/4-amino-4-deoxychorismate lyase